MIEINQRNSFVLQIIVLVLLVALGLPLLNLHATQVLNGHLSLIDIHFIIASLATLWATATITILKAKRFADSLGIEEGDWEARLLNICLTSISFVLAWNIVFAFCAYFETARQFYWLRFALSVSPIVILLNTPAYLQWLSYYAHKRKRQQHGLDPQG